MNDFSSTSNSGILKDNYSPLAEALKKRREKLKETKLDAESESELGNEAK